MNAREERLQLAFGLLDQIPADLEHVQIAAAMDADEIGCVTDIMIETVVASVEIMAGDSSPADALDRFIARLAKRRAAMIAGEGRP